MSRLPEQVYAVEFFFRDRPFRAVVVRDRNAVVRAIESEFPGLARRDGNRQATADFLEGRRAALYIHMPLGEYSPKYADSPIPRLRMEPVTVARSIPAEMA